MVILALTFSCFTFRVCAVDDAIDEPSPYAAIYAETDTDALFELRAKNILSPEDNQGAIEAIEQRLQQLGVEEISYTEVARLLEGQSSSNAQPRFTPTGTAGVTWYSERLVNVYNGKEYDIQIITGQVSGTNPSSSPLYYSENGIEKTYHGLEIGLVNALKVAAADVAVSIGSAYDPVVDVFYRPVLRCTMSW